MASHDVVLCSPVRTAIGAYNGSLKTIPAPELGAAVVPLDAHQADRPGELPGPRLDDRERRARALFPGASMAFDPGRRGTNRIRVRDVQCGVRDFAGAGEALDIPCVVERERTKGEALGGQRWLIRHSEESSRGRVAR